MGGDMQAQGHAQVLCNMIDFGMDVQEAGDAPAVPPLRLVRADRPAGRGRAARSPSSRASPPRSGAGSKPRATGSPRSPGAFGGYQAIRIDLERGVLIGGSDPRKDGCAMGY